ncbi:MULTISPECIES: CrcB family protein [Halomonadaceae]|uniref:fluoride efflux transporter FluC n=1 Tax=Halomonadaceae TaxID=28256 RepID=UPI0015998B2D|nr:MULTISPECIES: CrcB family protein [Halomonas]QJQ95444.1 chromosome condensation protein CrcB [Halomonas sp. PA5]
MPTTLGPLLVVTIGGALGGVLRVWLTARITARWGEGFPWGTLAVNTSGALLLGLLVGVTDATPAGAVTGLWLLLAVGVLGSYTTVSSFSLQSLALLQGMRPWQGVANVAASLGGCLLAAAVGIGTGQWLVSLLAGGNM